MEGRVWMYDRMDRWMDEIKEDTPRWIDRKENR